MPASSSASILRRLFTARRAAVLLLVLAAGTAVAWGLRARYGKPAAIAPPELHLVRQTEFVHDLTEQGTIESGNNTDVRCEVKSNNMAGTTILEIVPEGKMVEKDEVLARLDSSALESDRIKQQMAVSNSEAELIKAETALRLAVHAKEEYLGEEDGGKPAENKAAAKEGTFVQQQKAAQSEVFVAEENLRRAKEYARYSERLAAKGYVTKLQLEADRFAVDKAKKDLEVAELKLKVLVGYTKKKTLTQLNSDIDTAKAKLKAQKDSHLLECEKLALIEDQIRKCVVRAPAAGQVVYYNVTNFWGDKPTVVEAGATVRERQIMIRLPDREQMQVKARINESKIALVAMGMPATIRVDALPDVELEGTVVKVEEYPAPTNKFTSCVKEYETTIRIHKSPPGLRPGLTAEARIHVQRLAKAVQVPVQAVLEHGDRHYCVFYDGERVQAREVKLGSTNEKFVVVRDGLAASEEVVLNPAAFRKELGFDAAPREEKAVAALAADTQGKPAGLPPAVRRPAPPADALAGEAARIEKVFAQFDKNHLGRLRLAELPENVRAWAAKADTDGDGIVYRADLAATVSRTPSRNPGGRAVAARNDGRPGPGAPP